jgi:hypothetical protein
MAEDRITQQQADELVSNMGPMLAFFGRLQRRMEQTGKTNDELYTLAVKAYDSVHALRVGLHYRSCGKNIGLPYVVEPPKFAPTTPAE